LTSKIQLVVIVTNNKQNKKSMIEVRVVGSIINMSKYFEVLLNHLFEVWSSLDVVCWVLFVVDGS